MKNKILFITSEFPPLPGGIGNHAFLLANYLKINNYLVKVITNYRSNYRIDDDVFDQKQSFEIIRINRYKIVLLTYILRVFNVLIQTKNNEIVLASGKFSLWTAGIIKLFYKNKKVIAIIHGSEVNSGNKISKKMTFWSLRNIDVIIAVSDFTKNLALKHDNKLKIQVIHNGFELNNYDKLEIDMKGNPSVITVGNVTNRKGQQNFIEALPSIIAFFPEIHYHMVGIPTEKEKLTFLAKELNVSQYISFHGMVTEEKKHNLLSNSDIFLMLSNTIDNGEVEGFGIAILEANSLGIPVIGSLNSGISEAIKSGFNGILVNPSNAEEIQQALIEILENYDSFSLNSKDWAKNFNWSIVVNKYLTVLES